MVRTYSVQSGWGCMDAVVQESCPPRRGLEGSHTPASLHSLSVKVKRDNQMVHYWVYRARSTIHGA